MILAGSSLMVYFPHLPVKLLAGLPLLGSYQALGPPLIAS